MPVTVGEITSGIQEVQTIGDSVLKTVEGLDPAADVPAVAAGTILDLAAQLVSAALRAWSAASGTPITVASVQDLLPDQTPVVPPASS